MAGNQNITQYLHNFLDRRLLTIFLFGIASGFPWVMIGSAMNAWLQELGLTRTAIGLFGLIFVPYTFNFLWSPLLDRLKIPGLKKLLGMRRSWILLMQLLIVTGCLLMTQIDVANQLFIAGMAGLLISISSATQDIAIDAYRIDVIGSGDQQKIAAGAAMATSGWWTGYAFLGSVAFFAADIEGWSWTDAYLILAAIMASFTLIVIFIAKEPINDRELQQKNLEQQYLKELSIVGPIEKVQVWVRVTLVEPFSDFFKRNGSNVALSLLGFIFFFKIGEAFLGKMSIVFYKEIGFSNSDIGYYSKLLGGGITILFTIMGGIFTMRFGIVKGLFLGGVAMAASNLIFAAIAVVGPDKTLFTIAIVVDGYTQAWSTVAFVSFISMMCNQAFSASQYALLASLGNMNRAVIGSSGGWIVDSLDGNWALFFIITTLMVIPGLMILYHLRHELNAIEQRHKVT